ncbi:DUF2851 family protein [Roseimicrobium sp. ORNL1]|uniref:DUF2851 family protein n=1 Tax=Roseimicrobium sp. ORNL1 TaxID=2711231 RepID=UPI0013E1F097|nr:DUF2851 family protein [Roseimicrobium sp. ORNL1]QIF00084.1 DUF2851 family protein [Roseimicrobium sp. ORNL1]
MSYPVLAQQYALFRDSMYEGVAELPLHGESALTELELQSLWFAGELGSEFTTTCGKRVAVRDFGVWNHAAGPDFTGCAVQTEGGVLKGEIELDPDVRDWERHGHATNPAYERVALHLYLEGPEARAFTRTAGHREVMQVRLSRDMLRDGARPQLLAEARLGRCATPLREMEPARVRSLLEAAAQYRLQRKSAKLQALVKLHGREQAVYQALSAAMGYRNNQRPFTILAQRLPVKKLLKLGALEREALLFGVSGFLESVRYEDTQPDTRAYLRELWSEWWKQREQYTNWLTEVQRPVWRIGGARPGNHPQRRLGALCAMLGKWKGVYAFLKDAKTWSREGFSEALLELEHDYWSGHYTLLANPATKPLALVGGTRVQEILANVCYPLLVPENGKLWADYLELPAMLDNQKVRRAALRLFGEHPEAGSYQKRLYHQQGLLQIYEDYCLEDDSGCAECPFPEKLRGWQFGAV